MEKPEGKPVESFDDWSKEVDRLLGIEPGTETQSTYVSDRDLSNGNYKNAVFGGLSALGGIQKAVSFKSKDL